MLQEKKKIKIKKTNKPKKNKHQWCREGGMTAKFADSAILFCTTSAGIQGILSPRGCLSASSSWWPPSHKRGGYAALPLSLNAEEYHSQEKERIYVHTIPFPKGATNKVFLAWWIVTWRGLVKVDKHFCHLKLTWNSAKDSSSSFLFISQAQDNI